MRKHLSLVSILLSFAVTVAGQTPPPAQTPAQPATPAPQQPAPTPAQDEDTDEGEGESQVTTRRSVAQDDRDNQREDVVRITTNLVQIDVIVTDSSGRQVTDLKPEDFEIYEEGRAQPITNFSYVTPPQAAAALGAAAPPAAIPLSGVTTKKGKAVMVKAPVPPVKLRPEQVRRTVALVVDDLGLSHESSSRVRQALRKFIDEEVQPGDLVAVIRTGAGMGALQQFTTDKRLLQAAIDRIRYNLAGRGAISTFSPLGGDVAIQFGTEQRAYGDNDPTAPTSHNAGAAIDQFREELFSVGTLGALNFIVRGLRDVPGRKSVVLFSDGFKMYSQDPGNRRVLDSVNRLIDLANRASVIFYTIDPRGLQAFNISAADNLNGPIRGFGSYPGDPRDVSKMTVEEMAARGGIDLENGGTIDKWLARTTPKMMPEHTAHMARIASEISDRRGNFFESQHGLSFLAEQTGGFLVKNNNDIGGAVRRVMNDQSGFYLIGYRPEDSTTKGGARSFRNLTVKVKRSGLRVRTRKGFYNFTDEEARRPVRRTASEQLFAALTSPFGAADVRLRMTAAFGYDYERKTHFTQSLLHIDTRDVTFRRQPDGTRQSVLELMAVTFGDSGKVIDSDDRAYTVRIDEADFQRAQAAGLVYTVTLPIKKPGAYQLRIAVRDQATGKVGAANQFINVPDVKKGGLTLSGVTLRGAQGASAVKASGAGGEGAGVVQSAPLAGAGRVADTDPHAGPAGRRLRRGMVLQYGYFIYNAQLDRATSRPQLVTQLRLFRDGRLVYEGKVKDFDAAPQADGKSFLAGGALLIGKDLQPGEYVLQVVAYDRLAPKEDRALATQWIDFDIVE
ncbi:MAG TPA: VWA domain-containing protein [Pyrinomonadaceae bacterium]|nr:VWA domain-containing protein [Pyrinomonadaceae bacterium]